MSHEGGKSIIQVKDFATEKKKGQRSEKLQRLCIIQAGQFAS